MFARSLRSGLMLGIAMALVACSNPQGLDSVAVSPTSSSLAVGQTVQLTATGTFGNAKKPTTKDITTAVTWSSTSPSVATVSASGLATAVAPGTTAITASSTGYAGPVSSSAVITVQGATTGSGSTGGTGGNGTITSGADILSLTIIPNGIAFGALGQSGQYLAIGTFATPPLIRDVTNQVTWLTSEPNKFPVSNNIASGAAGAGTQNGGVVSAYEASVGNVGATITAEFLDKTGSLAVATATVGCPFKAATATDPGSCNNYVPQLLSTLTIYNEGLNSAVTGNWLVTAVSAVPDPSIPGSYIADPNRIPLTPTVLHCGPGWAKNGQTGGSICTVTYPLSDPILFPSARTRVILTAPAQNGVTFGGWSANCRNATLVPAGPNTCTIDLQDTDATVGAIFN